MLLALFGGSHTSHHFKPIDEVYDTHKEQILDQVKLLKKRQTELISHIQEVEKNIELVKNGKDEKVIFRYLLLMTLCFISIVILFSRSERLEALWN